MLRWFEQEQQTSCVAACVRMVLGGFGVACEEEQIRQWLGSPRLGISLMAAQAQLSKAGANVEWHDDWSLDDLRDVLRRNDYPIIGVEREILGFSTARHAVVLVNLTSRGVKALDPYDGPGPQEYSLQSFEKAWKLAGKEALLIVSPPIV